MQQINLDFVPSGVRENVYASQYDIGRSVRFNLKDNGATYTLTGAETVTLKIRKPDNTERSESIANTSSTYVIWTSVYESCDLDGLYDCKLKVVNGSVEIGSANFTLHAEVDPYSGRVVILLSMGNPAFFNTNLGGVVVDCTSELPYNPSGYTTATAINSKTAPIHDFAPYHTRINNNIGNLALEKLVGVSCVFNQLANINTGVVKGTTISLDDNGVIEFSGVTTGNPKITHITHISGHKYLCLQKTIANPNNIDFTLGMESGSPWIPDGDIIGEHNSIYTSIHDTDFNLYYASNQDLTGIKLSIQIIDLTAMFGSTVADYIYTLESGNAGAGVSLFKSLFADEYYPYTSNTLMSAKPTSKVIKDSNDQTVATIVYSGNELRGLLKVGTDGLYADGDIDDGSGSTQVRYELRAYQSGDESLTDAITDGTNTVVKLATPTTAVSTAWSNPIIAKEGGTEEFIDTRAIKMFTGHDTIYGTDMTVNKAEFGTTVYGGSVDFTTGDVISNKNADGTDKTAETIAISPVMVGVFEGDNYIISDANGSNSVKYFKKG